MVKMSLTFPGLTTLLNDTMQTQLKTTVASVAVVSVSAVNITQFISSSRRRLLAAGVTVNVTIQAPTYAAASSAALNLNTGSALYNALVNVGLPAPIITLAVALTIPPSATQTPAPLNSGGRARWSAAPLLSLALAVGAVVAAAVPAIAN